MFDRRTIIAIVLVGIVLLLMPKYMELISPKRPPSTMPVDTSSVFPPIVSDTVTAPARTDIVLPPPLPTTSAIPSDRPLADTAAVDPQMVTVETDRFWLTIGTNAQITGYTLKKYRLTDKRPVQLHVSERAFPSERMIGTLDFDLGPRSYSTLGNMRFNADRSSLAVTASSDSVVLTADNAGQYVSITYVFHPDRYGFEVSLRTRGLPVPETGEFRTRWLGGVPVTEPDPVRDLQYAGSYARVGDQLEELQARETRRDFNATGQTHFVAARSKYFVAAIIPASPAAGAEILARNLNPKDKRSPHYYDLTLRESWQNDAAGRWTVYWGPIKYNELKSLRVGLEQTMNWGWKIIQPFSKAVLWSLTALGAAIPNYGIVIVLFSIIVKIILWPLTRKSQVSMRKMAALQPEIQALRQIHTKNPQAMNQAIMATYKRNKVNPASGCIPVVLQMPLLYALFIIFSTTIEFRQSPFFFWITDLSQPDVIFNLPFSLPLYGAGVCLLPIVMGVTQFFMAKRTTTDPNQKAMIYIMPVFMTVIFNTFPSGLTLYYTLFNVLAIFEQNLIKMPAFDAVVSEETKKLLDQAKKTPKIKPSEGGRDKEKKAADPTDPDSLAREAVSEFASYWSALIEGKGSVPAAVSLLWKTVGDRLKSRPSAEVALKDVKDDPFDDDNVAAFRKELKKALVDDTAFAQSVAAAITDIRGKKKKP